MQTQLTLNKMAMLYYLAVWAMIRKSPVLFIATIINALVLMALMVYQDKD